MRGSSSYAESLHCYLRPVHWYPMTPDFIYRMRRVVILEVTTTVLTVAGMSRHRCLMQRRAYQSRLPIFACMLALHCIHCFSTRVCSHPRMASSAHCCKRRGLVRVHHLLIDVGRRTACMNTHLLTRKRAPSACILGARLSRWGCATCAVIHLHDGVL